MLSTLLALVADVMPFPRNGPSASMLIGSGFVFYVITAFSLMRIAKKTRFSEDAIMAWIPLLNLFLMLKIADRPAWWVVLFFIPCAGTVAWVLVWLGVAKTLRRSALMGLFAAVIPIIGLPLLALSD